MSKRDTPEIKTREDLAREMRFVVQRLYTTPSMVDKLPKYLMERIDRINDWARRYGWE